jgi:hypothetical protein
VGAASGLCGFVAVAVAVAVVGCGDDEASRPRPTDCGNLPVVAAPAVPAAPPPEQRAMFVADVEGPTAEGERAEPYASDGTDDPSSPVAVVLYGSGGDDPFAEADLGVWSSSDPAAVGALESEQDEQRHTTTVRGHEAFIARSGADDMLNDDGATEIAWAECDDLGISLRSHRYSLDELVSLAEMLRVDEDGVGLEPGAADDLAEVLALPSVAWMGPADLPAGTGLRTVTYYDAPVPNELGFDDATYSVHALTAGDRAAAEVLRTLYRFDHPGARRVQREGHDALRYPHPSDLGRFDVFWMDSPTVAVIVSGYNTDGGGLAGGGLEAGTLALAEALRPATPDEAADLLTADPGGS